MYLKPLAASLGIAVVVVACAQAPTAEGRVIYAENCVACHGSDGTGDGPLAGQLDIAPPDLKLISQRNGGVFPMADVLSTIDGYTRRTAGPIVMPEFGIDLQAGPLVYIDTGDGRRTPTPSRLFALAEYLRSIQE